MKLVIVASVLASVALAGCGKYEAASRNLTPPVLKPAGGGDAGKCDPGQVLSAAIARDASTFDAKTLTISTRVTTDAGSAQGWTATSADGKTMLGVELVDQSCQAHGISGVEIQQDISTPPSADTVGPVCDPANALLSTLKASAAKAKSASVSNLISANKLVGGASAVSWIATMPDGSRELGIFLVDPSCKVFGTSGPLN